MHQRQHVSSSPGHLHSRRPDTVQPKSTGVFLSQQPSTPIPLVQWRHTSGAVQPQSAVIPRQACPCPMPQHHPPRLPHHPDRPAAVQVFASAPSQTTRPLTSIPPVRWANHATSVQPQTTSTAQTKGPSTSPPPVRWAHHACPIQPQAAPSSPARPPQVSIPPVQMPSAQRPVQMMHRGIGAGLLGLGGVAAAYLYDRYLASDETRLRVRRYTSRLWGETELSNIIGEAVGNIDTGVATVAGGSATPLGQTTRTPGPAGGRVGATYVAALDDTVTDRDRRLSYLLHELTHVSVDQSAKYTMNALPGAQFINVKNPTPAAGAAALPNLAVHTALLSQALANAQQILANDPAIPRLEAAYIRGRLAYAQASPMTEFDTVVNELLLYMYRRGVPRTSPTYSTIRALAAQARTNR